MQPRLLALPAVLALSLLAPTATSAQENSLKEVLSGKTTPLTIRLRELTPEWRRLTIQTPETAKGGDGGGGLLGMMGMLMGGMLGGMPGFASSSPPIYTQGQTISLGGETFLVTYRAPLPTLDVTALMKADKLDELPPPETLKPDSTLSLSLIKVREIQSINDIRPFNLEQELKESEQAAAAEAAARRELAKQAGPFGGGAIDVAPRPDFDILGPDALPPPPPAPPKVPAKAPAKKPAPRKK